MKHYEIRLHIKPTEIKYLGFKQSTNCFATFLMAKDFLAASWRDAARVMTEIFGDEIIDLEITYTRAVSCAMVASNPVWSLIVSQPEP